jgi:CRP/FNR family cyclic AMP-dependent transcriptional regulator
MRHYCAIRSVSGQSEDWGAVDAPDVAKLSRVGLFADLDEAQLHVMANWLETEAVYVGADMTHEGASGYAFCIIEDAAADVLIGGEVVRSLGPGDFFGELSMLGEGRQTATVRITSPGTVWTLFGTRFRQLQIEQPEIAAVIEETAADRLAGR